MKTPMKLAIPVAAGLILAAADHAMGQGQAQPRAQTAEPQGQAPGSGAARRVIVGTPAEARARARDLYGRGALRRRVEADRAVGARP